MRTKKSYEGVILIDHSNSPGTDLVPAGTVLESASVRCSHCHAYVVLNPQRTRPRGYCGKCNDYYCDNPGCNPIRYNCVPLDAVLDELQEEAYRNLNIKEI